MRIIVRRRRCPNRQIRPSLPGGETKCSCCCCSLFLNFLQICIYFFFASPSLPLPDHHSILGYLPTIIPNSPMTHAAGNPHPPHLVYVRRKPDAELAAPTPSPPFSPHNPTPAPAVASFNLPKPKSSAHDDDHGANHPDLDSLEARVLSPQASPALRLPWEGRISQLNNLFNKLDQSDQKGYIETLRSLSSVELSKLAVELEKRFIRLSLDEAKELQRVRVLDVLDRYSKHSRAHTTDQNVSEK